MAAEQLPLHEALVEWCTPELVERVRAEERQLSEYELDQTSRIQLTPRTQWRQPTSTSWKIDTDLTKWLASWSELERDLRRRIEGGRMYVSGVQAKPERRRELEELPAAWAADFKFEFGLGAITVGEYRFTEIACSLEDRTATVPNMTIAPTANPAALRPEDVSDLSDEMIVTLLEEHARRVVECPDAKLSAAAQASLMPLIKRKLLHRAKQNEVFPSLAEEMSWLADWIAEKAPSFHVPQAKSIGNILRSDYNRVRAQAKGITA